MIFILLINSYEVCKALYCIYEITEPSYWIINTPPDMLYQGHNRRLTADNYFKIFDHYHNSRWTRRGYARLERLEFLESLRDSTGSQNIRYHQFCKEMRFMRNAPRILEHLYNTQQITAFKYFDAMDKWCYFMRYNNYLYFHFLDFQREHDLTVAKSYYNNFMRPYQIFSKINDFKI